MSKEHFILAVDTKAHFIKDEIPFRKYDYNKFLKEALFYLTIKQRANLDGVGEKEVALRMNADELTPNSLMGKDWYPVQTLTYGNPSFRQILPYTVFQLEGTDKFATYVRTKKVGEARLSGNSSVGFGGHVDLADFRLDSEASANKSSSISLGKTLSVALQRELSEELFFDPAFALETILDKADTSFYLLNDTSNEVGKLHLGLVRIFTVPTHCVLGVKEEELQWLGFLSKDDILEANPESWTKIILQSI